MALTIWSFTPLILAPIAALALIALLRWRLQVPAGRVAERESAHAPASGLASGSPRNAVTWDQVDARWNPLVTNVLPTLVGIAIVFLTAWPFAYAGWAFLYFGGIPGAAQLIPPWFGNPGYILGFGLIGAMLALAVGAVASLILLALYLIGKSTIWPQPYGGNDEQPGNPDP